MSDPFDAFVEALRRRGMDVRPQPLAPQAHPTSRPLAPFTKAQVRLLVGPLPLPTAYTRAGTPRKHQPRPLQAGDVAYVSRRADGRLTLYPFERAGTGYELLRDAREGTHFVFV